MANVLVFWFMPEKRIGLRKGRPTLTPHHFARPFGIGDPFVVELIGACRDAAVAFAGIDHSGITAVHQLEEMVFGLSVLACVADQHLRKLGVLNAVILLATLPKRAAIKPDDR